MKGHLENRGKNTYLIVLEHGKDADGKRTRRKHTFHGTKRQAEEEKVRLLHRMQTGTYIDENKLTVGEYLRRWLEDSKRGNVSPRTFERYDSIVTLHLIPALGVHKLKDLRPMHIQTYYTEARESGRLQRKGSKPDESNDEAQDASKDEAQSENRGLSTQTVAHHHRVLFGALKQAVRWRILTFNPADAVNPPRPDKHEMKVLDEEQTRALIEASRDTDLYVPILLAVTTGMRLGELLGLHWRDVDLKRGKLAVTQSLQATKNGLEFRQPKTKKSRRSIPLTSTAAEALRQHKKAQLEHRMANADRYEDNDLVFPREYGKPWNPRTFSSSWTRQRDSMGLDIRFHDLRHTHATLLLRQGVHVKVVSERLGHSTVGITLDTYSHVLPDMQEEATEKLEAMLAGLTPAVSGR